MGRGADHDGGRRCRALDALSGVDLSTIPEETRRTLWYRAREVRKRLDDILSALEA